MHITTMNIKLKVTDHFPENVSIALLPTGEEVPFVTLAEPEMALWKNRHDKDEPIVIQRLPYHLFISLPDLQLPAHQVLEKYRKAGSRFMELVRKMKLENVGIAGSGNPEYTLAFTEGFLLGGYAFQKYKKEKTENLPESVSIFHAGLEKDQLREMEILAEAVYWARDLVNEPLSTLNALALSDQFIQKGKESGYTVEVFHKKDIESLKMGGLLAVNKGSIDPPTFTVMEWKPENPVNGKPVVIVGKGVVYDTGGMSLKPTPKSMDYMKCDMAGAAATGAVVYAAARANLPVHVIGLVPATDNRPDGNAYVPGDVITMFDGTTVEVLNTDAEGRLILADALGYAQKYDPMLVIDLATLTGAASIISGSHGMIAMGNQSEYLNQLKVSGDEIYERIVELPLWEEYGFTLKSDIADMTNMGGRDGQTIIAGKFLEHFTDYPWIHLDIAGTAWLFEKDSYRPKGGTGSGIRLLFNFLKKL